MSEPQNDPNKLAEMYPVVGVMLRGRKFTAAFVGPAMGKGMTPLSYWVCHDSAEKAKEKVVQLGGQIWCKFLGADGDHDLEYYCQHSDPYIWTGLVGPCAALVEYNDRCELCGHLNKSHKPLACTIVMQGVVSGPCDCKVFVAQK